MTGEPLHPTQDDVLKIQIKQHEVTQPDKQKKEVEQAKVDFTDILKGNEENTTIYQVLWKTSSNKASAMSWNMTAFIKLPLQWSMTMQQSTAALQLVLRESNNNDIIRSAVSKYGGAGSQCYHC